MRLQQVFADGEMGFGVELQSSNPEPLMSALGHKRTLKSFRPMSALPPIADTGIGSNPSQKSGG